MTHYLLSNGDIGGNLLIHKRLISIHKMAISTNRAEQGYADYENWKE